MLKYRRLEIASMTHYHIHWSGKEQLDWEAFDSHADAEISAAQLVRPGETYKIEERDRNCVRCQRAFQLKTAHDLEPEPVPKYAWQQAVWDAFQAAPENLPLKVNVAQRAISARLCDKTPTDIDEQIAIHEALHSLSALLPEPNPKHSSENQPEPNAKKQTA